MKLPTFTAVVVSHHNNRGLRAILGNLMYQTVPPDETIALMSNTGAVMRLREDFPHVNFLEQENREDWGHDKRATGLQMATQDYVGFFNDDDSYANDYLEKMLTRAAEGNDVVYCAWNTIPGCHFGMASSTSGNFIFRREVGLEAGYSSREYAADGHFIEALNSVTGKISKVGEILYFHNVGA